MEKTKFPAAPAVHWIATDVEGLFVGEGVTLHFAKGSSEIPTDAEADALVAETMARFGIEPASEPADVQKLARAFDRAWHLTAENLPTWDRDCEPRKLTTRAST